MPVVGQHPLGLCQMGGEGVEKEGQRGLDGHLLSGLKSTKTGKSAFRSFGMFGKKSLPVMPASCCLAERHPSISCSLRSLGLSTCAPISRRESLAAAPPPPILAGRAQVVSSRGFT